MTKSRLAVVVSLFALACSDAPDTTSELYLAKSTREMSRILGQAFREMGSVDFDEGGIEWFRKHLSDEYRLDEGLKREVLNAYRSLLSGDNEVAIDRFVEIRNQIEGTQSEEPARELMHALLGISWMRLGEQENCVLNHTSDSCLFPIGAEGVHRVERGSRNAIAEFEALLALTPDDMGTMWLLNLAYMTLGEWPDAVPAKWRIEREQVESEFEVARWRDVAPATGVAAIGLAGGALTEDLDGDGRLDLIATSSGPTDAMAYFWNAGNGRFEDRTERAGFLGEVGGINITHADYDNDGDADLLVLRGGWLHTSGLYPDSLIQNNGDGTFEDVTKSAGLFDLHPTHSAAFADYDGDGWLDLFVGHESSPIHEAPSRLWHSDGAGSFADASAQVGLDVRSFVKGVTWGDFDDDGRPDLFLATIAESNRLYRNRKRKNRLEFVDVTERAGVGAPMDGFTSWFWDYDNDGQLDLFVAGFSLRPGNSIDDAAALQLGLDSAAVRARLYRNAGNRRFEDVTTELGLDKFALSMGANYGDIDNDGWLDCYIGTGEPKFEALIPNRLLRNDRGQRFQDVTTAAGMGHVQKGHGIAFADMDGDGDQDVYANLGGWYSGDAFQNALFVNPGNDNHWITLRLVGKQSNRSAIGARIRVRVRDEGGERDIHLLCGTGGSFGSSSLQQEIGLGSASSILELELRWPGSETKQLLKGLPLDRVVEIQEDRAEFKVIDVKPSAFSVELAPGTNHGH
ncbi:MAG: hypothetical protein ACI8TQ_002452 [Planctomycetota bacterium]|jgi:hypothetical protein